MLCTESTYWVSGTLTPSRLDSWTLFLEDGSPIGHVLGHVGGWQGYWASGEPAGRRQQHLGRAMDLIEFGEADEELFGEGSRDVVDFWYWQDYVG